MHIASLHIACIKFFNNDRGEGGADDSTANLLPVVEQNMLLHVPLHGALRQFTNKT